MLGVRAVGLKVARRELDHVIELNELVEGVVALVGVLCDEVLVPLLDG